MPSEVRASLNHKCSTCSKTFPSRGALRSNIGTNELASATAHPCSLCGQRFCSATALQQHQDAPSHDTIFECNKCKRTFRSKQARAAHQKALGHTNNSAATKFIKEDARRESTDNGRGKSLRYYRRAR